jgi:hypothetical protein
MPLTLNVPDSLVVAVERVPVSGLVTTTVAPLIGAPPAETVPRIDEVVSCAEAAMGATSAMAATPRNRLLRI